MNPQQPEAADAAPPRGRPKVAHAPSGGSVSGAAEERGGEVPKRYRLKPSGCCDLPRVVHLTDAEAAPGLASGLLEPLPPTMAAPVSEPAKE